MPREYMASRGKGLLGSGTETSVVSVSVVDVKAKLTFGHYHELIGSLGDGVAGMAGHLRASGRARKATR